MNIKVIFPDKKIHKAFVLLKDSKDNQNRNVYKWINRAIDDIKINPYCGILIRKRSIPKKYIKKYKIDNLWKYDLPSGWRLIYSLVGNKILIISLILEWCNHKNYERIFKY